MLYNGGAKENVFKGTASFGEYAGDIMLCSVGTEPSQLFQQMVPEM
jgi:hypothetical protein